MRQDTVENVSDRSMTVHSAERWTLAALICIVSVPSTLRQAFGLPSAYSGHSTGVGMACHERTFGLPEAS